ncbi:MAG: hypothetical protein US95_C0041G0004 [Candidatus Woesebacteria bacterium GW2011_GWB1_38_5]|uniref:Uncharacterized protein n=1 Tax=Candidatus Woesebacteria bacterium GW2011_GWB1_38_5 TaxID=1618568 RepID=A0A0G0K527_9BACT|nr:MAG: hypothetical protein US95_C0041G0004 [Candidatus Woesebacteria bacterium GW2011_GWB1_38_5]
MKNDLLDIVKECLDKERETILKAITSTKRARDNAPSAMESHHDTERNQNETLVSALEEKLKELDDLTNNLPKDINGNNISRGFWSYHEIVKDDSLLKIIIVPDGYGGREAEGIKLVSINTPIARSILET